MRKQGKFDAYRLFSHNKFARRKENKENWMHLKFKKKFHKYLNNYMLHLKLRKERG